MADQQNVIRNRLRAALAVAILSDVIQIGLFPLFIEGAISPIDDALDLFVAGAMCWLLGFHVVFLPTFFIKELLIANIAPTWTAAYFTAAGKSKAELRQFQWQWK